MARRSHSGVEHHLIRREEVHGSGRASDGTALIDATRLEEGHAPAKMIRSKRLIGEDWL